MDKQKEIEKMACDMCLWRHGCNAPNEPIDSCKPLHMAKKAVEAGYRDVRYVVKEVLNKVFRYVEEARLECEFQDKDGKWFMDEGEFICEFTLGKYIVNTE